MFLKNWTILISINRVIFLLCILFSCKKEKPESVEIFWPGEQLFGAMSASKRATNSTIGNWEASGWATYETWGLLVIRGDTYTEDGYRRESLFLNEIPNTLGTYVLAEGFNFGNSMANAIYSRMEGDGDAIGADYFPSGSLNIVEITEIDTLAKQIKGRFNIHFKIASNWEGGKYPDEVWLENGEFDVHYE